MITIFEPAGAEKDEISWRPQLVAFASATVAGMLVLLAFGTWDRTRRSDLESIAQVTAVGDTTYFPMPNSANATAPQTTYRGDSLYAVSTKKIGIKDSLMERVGQIDSGEYWLYAPRQEVKAQHAGVLKKGEGLFLKVDEHEFLRLQPNKPAK
jgi:hypothetical protein